MIESNERTDVSAPNDNHNDPGSGPRDRTLRAGDKERDAVSEILRQRHVEGRLDADEFHARLDRCLQLESFLVLLHEIHRLILSPGRRRPVGVGSPQPGGHGRSRSCRC